MSMGNAAERRDEPAEPQQWFTTKEAAIYLRLTSAEALVKHVQRGHITPDRPRSPGGLRCHLFSRQTLDRFGRGK
jgi:hypothetical protein